MRLTGNLWKRLATTWGSGSASKRSRRPRRVELSWDCLEERKVLSHVGGHHAHHAQAVLASLAAESSSTTSTTGSTTESTTASTAAITAASTTSSTTSSSTSSSALSTAKQTLQNDIQTIELASGTTVGELTAIMMAFETLKTDGLTPSSASALSSFENSLVTAYASGTTLAGDATLLSQFEGIYTPTGTTLTATQTTDLGTAYNALAAAVTSSNITSADITTVNNDYAAVLAAEGSTSTATFQYFSLVTGRGGPGDPGGMEGGCH
jgi:hypothetical protein